MLKSKFHMATVTQTELLYEGSITIDEDLLEAAEIHVHEQVRISNINNGERFETYVLPGKRGSGIFALNGAAARKAVVGDRIIVFCYVYLTEEEIKNFKPKIFIFDNNNKIKLLPA
jgi:aspartate 1-decarboxylase